MQSKRRSWKDDHYGKPRRRSCNAGKESAAHRRRPTGRLNHLSRLAGYRQLGYHACNETHRYTVLCSVNVGEKEVILASNEQSTNGDKFMCGFAERNDLFELCSECMVSDDYIEIVHLFGSRVANEAELFKEQVEKLDIPITLITEADCIPDHYSKDINGKIIAIDPKVLKPEFQRADRQLYYVTGGFGASANSRGSAVFCTNLHTGKSTRYERMDVMGEIKPERLPEWAKEKAQELSNKKRNKDKER